MIGIVIGGLISYLLLDYQDQSYEIKNYYGADKSVTEWDWVTISYTGTIIIIVSILCSVIWTFIEKEKLRD
jgi:hypothetical protein